jgi:dTDP-4-amino-4,6-dideoxygalactose transaminase
MPKLAIKGGTPVRTKLFPAYNTIGAEEKAAVVQVLDSGNLSQYLGAWTHDFLGGPTVRAFESAWSTAFGVAHSISVNSNTSGLFTAMGAIGIQPGDEVIVSPYTMSASAIAPLVYGGIPVFADIDPVTFCMDPTSIAQRITPRTKAILVVHIFGHAADMDQIMALARQHNLHVVEDCAQAPLGKYKGRNVGTIGHLGVFSLNYHKHIHTGEGGVIVTNDSRLADRCQMIRNHAENVTAPRGIEDLTNLIGYNYRMTEIECAIGIEQLRKLPQLLDQRLRNVAFIERHLAAFPFLKLQPAQTAGSVHTYYVHPIKFDGTTAGIDRNTFVSALKAEVPSAILRETAPLLGAGYVKPLYLQPIYQKKAAWAYNPALYNGSVNYEAGLCPVTERMHFHELITHEFMRPGMTEEDMLDVIRAIDKVFSNVHELTPVSG